MPLLIVRNDITKMNVDAIVNAAKTTLLGGGGVDGCIHRAAGPQLLEECKKLGGCPTGSAKITGAGQLPCRYVIHAVGPVWQGGYAGEREKLTSCYRTALEIAREHHCETIAFPLISSGAYGYPREEAMEVATESITRFLEDNEMTVYLVVFDRQSFQISEKRFHDIAKYIDDQYTQPFEADVRRRMLQWRQLSPGRLTNLPDRNLTDDAMMAPAAAAPAPMEKAGSLEDAMKMLDESFSEMLLRKIDEKGISDAACYKKANIDRRLFSKIRKDRLYKPNKATAVAFAIALELPLEETKEMLMKAGYALSRSSKFDIIVEYFITRGNYNIYEINEALFAFDQSLLGV